MNTLVHHRSHHALIRELENSRNKSKDKNHQNSVTQYEIVQMIRTIYYTTCIRLIRRERKRVGCKTAKVYDYCDVYIRRPGIEYKGEHVGDVHARVKRRRTAGKNAIIFRIECEFSCLWLFIAYIYIYNL